MHTIQTLGRRGWSYLSDRLRVEAAFEPCSGLNALQFLAWGERVQQFIDRVSGVLHNVGCPTLAPASLDVLQKRETTISCPLIVLYHTPVGCQHWWDLPQPSEEVQVLVGLLDMFWVLMAHVRSLEMWSPRYLNLWAISTAVPPTTSREWVWLLLLKSTTISIVLPTIRWRLCSPHQSIWSSTSLR